jgi:hypothetical protein
VTARQELRAAGVNAQPLAFGITKWGPLPGTADMWIMWDGPGAQLFAYATDPAKRGSLGRRIMHPAANGHYQTVADAERALLAFVDAAATLAAAEHGES